VENPRSGSSQVRKTRGSRPHSRRQLERELAALADPQRAETAAWFFKTAKGKYGEGDRFLGIRVPALRKMALKYRDLGPGDVSRLLSSPLHEHRFVALVILVAQYEKGGEPERERVFRFYLENTRGINNWDLVDTSAPYIIGEHVRSRPREILDQLAVSPSLWERRIAIVSTLMLIRHGEVEDTFRLAKMLLSDADDLMHKAVGWMLREAGKVSSSALLAFLEENYASVPRTTLRYAIERFPLEERKRLLGGRF